MKDWQFGALMVWLIFTVALIALVLMDPARKPEPSPAQSVCIEYRGAEAEGYAPGAVHVTDCRW